jgi:hypothetical protein
VLIITLPFKGGRLNILKTLYKVYIKQVLNLEHLKVFSYIVYLILLKNKHSYYFIYKYKPGYIFIKI